MISNYPTVLVPHYGISSYKCPNPRDAFPIELSWAPDYFTGSFCHDERLHLGARKESLPGQEHWTAMNAPSKAQTEIQRRALERVNAPACSEITYRLLYRWR
jgi:hypothetical protein